MIPFKQAHEALTSRDSEKVKSLEAEIDRGLKGYTGHPIQVNVANVPDLVIAAVRKMYEEGGWATSIDSGSDQRDNSSWTLLVIGPGPTAYRPSGQWEDR